MKSRLEKGEDDLKGTRVLNKIVRVTKDGLRYEPDPRHAASFKKSSDLERCNTVVTPGVKVPYEEEIEPIEDEISPSYVSETMVDKIATSDKPGFDPNIESMDLVRH